MKKFIVSGLIGLLVVVLVIMFNVKDVKDNDGLVEVKVAEVAHSIFYAPQYLADALGYFEEEGLDVEITLASGADAVMASVLAGEVDIGFCGTEATI